MSGLARSFWEEGYRKEEEALAKASLPPAWIATADQCRSFVFE
jgi:hypothetical protein